MMIGFLRLFLLALPVAMLPVSSPSAAGRDAHPRVLLRTSEGDIVIELDRDKAPLSVDNFLGYVERGFYNGTIFHRSIKGFMVQGGGFTADYERKPTGAAIKNEADNGLHNTRGTVAMARTADPDSATAQFFINTVDNPHLDFHSRTETGWGYAVFGKVVEGMDVVDRIQEIPTSNGGPFPRDVPRKTVTIESATLLPKAGHK
jgi:cyclophilin family peptidyl-prolyl cis-trans isomerase